MRRSGVIALLVVLSAGMAACSQNAPAPEAAAPAAPEAVPAPAPDAAAPAPDAAATPAPDAGATPAPQPATDGLLPTGE